MPIPILIGTVVAYAGEVVDVGQPVEVPTAGSGWFLCNGAALDSHQFSELFTAIRAAHGNGSDDQKPVTDFNLPDYRGYFLRGVSGPTNRDPDRGDGDRPANHPGGNVGNRVGSVQADTFAIHRHTTQGHHLEASGGHGFDGSGFMTNSAPNSTFDRQFPTSDVGGRETRPKNAYVHWIIKAK
jgi:rhizosphere induced protein